MNAKIHFLSKILLIIKWTEGFFEESLIAPAMANAVLY